MHVLRTFGRQAMNADLQPLVHVVVAVEVNLTLTHVTMHHSTVVSKSTESCSCLRKPHRSGLVGEGGGLDCVRFLVFGSLQTAGFMFACFIKNY